MTYASVKEFVADWRDESAKTALVMAALTDASLERRVGPEDRTLGRIAWHVVHTVGEMMSRTGLPVEVLPEKVPASAAAIAAAQRKAAEGLATAVEGAWKDADLLLEDDMYGMRWKRGMTVGGLIAHEIHHRGQMTVLMRQAGLRVPGVYGPAREEWAGFGMPAPEV
ncbi:MAG: hypothetical protein HUU06_12950 [Planctomycetaceae bacterium]|nr:DinB family protein [Planctomycetota bacterium]NUN53675.1 hypothetical protein [Planctomycetaceae bacterium]